MSKILLEAKELYVNYGAIQALAGFSLKLMENEIVSVIGANGAGKSTFMNAIMGMVKISSGEIFLEGYPLSSQNYKIVRSGLCLVPEGRRVFTSLTVDENLRIGAFTRKDISEINRDYEWVFSLFPILKERLKQYAGTLSGGEQQMLAIARALMARPRVLLLDEPSLGLAPIIIRDIFKELKQINEQGVSILLVEQNARQALLLSHRAYVLQTGRLLKEGLSKDLLEDKDIKAAYLGQSA
ncbi:MAG: ABC transporter ATP-binding protein [Synergistaceae bacterium]|nr:ABC transporter ATP-binding protein [Synergistaceae bacterium]MBQ9594297.1 ABC transporter ATP-binding protein [Synergistaceae bacterium]MBR0204149.1 ABC transporter ATP-binding protein [Synergistaceae bacterium]